MHEFEAWILFPLIALAICTGVGRLVVRAAAGVAGVGRAGAGSTAAEQGGGIGRAAHPALGIAGSIVLLTILFATGMHAWLALVALVIAAILGFWLTESDEGRPIRRFRHFRWPGAGFLVGLATYVLHLSPVAFTGQATFLGYNLLNDTAIHLAIVDYIGDHGSRFVHQPPSSFGAAINDYVGSRYPLGAHELLAALKPAVGLDAAQLYQPFLAFCAAAAAAAIYGFLKRELNRPLVAAVAGFAALASQLVFSFALQGSIKELAFIACLAAAAAAVRSPVAVAICAAALYSIYGLSSMAWILPLALATLILTRPSLRQAATATVVFVLAIAVELVPSIDYYHHGQSVLTSSRELGPLAGPLKPLQAAGIWLNGDYRFSPNPSWITYTLAIGLIVIAIFGLAAAIRTRKASLLVFLAAPLIAAIATAPSASPYIQAKLLAIVSPAVVACAAVGLSSLRRAALPLAIVLGVAILVSDALAYRVALPAPANRLAELSQIDKRLPQNTRVLVNEYEEYVKHYMRRTRASDPYESWTGGRARLRNPKLPVAAHEYDLDQMKASFVESWPYIVLRRSPAASRPPSNYRLLQSGRFYELWKRTGPAPATHIPLGQPPFDPTRPLDCKLVRRLGSGAVAAIRPRPSVITLGSAKPLPPGWYRYGQNPRMLEIHKGGSITLPAGPAPADSATSRGQVQFWIRGQTTRTSRLIVDGRALPVPRALQRIWDWIPIGGGALARHTLTLHRPTRSLRPGDAQPDIVGPIVQVAAAAPVLVRGAQLRQACGAPADWIDVLPKG